MLPHLYHPSTVLPSIPTSESTASPTYFERLPDTVEFIDFFEDVLDELALHGRVDDMLIVHNAGEHLQGNVYVRFRTEEECADALKAVQGRWYRGRRVEGEFSPVTDFSEAVCGMFRGGFCERGEFCNFIHARPLTRELRRRLKEAGEKRRERVGEGGGRGRERGKSPRREGGRSRSRSPSGGEEEEDEEEWESPEARRARIAQWNAERERQANAAPAANGGAGTEPSPPPPPPPAAAPA